MIIYLITNVVNRKRYVGKTSKSIEERFQRHCYLSDRNSQTHFHRAIRKYGKENFKIELLEESDREEYWIAELKPEYNMTKGGDGGDTSSSPNFKQAMIDYHTSKPRSSYASYGMLGKRGSRVSRENNKCPVMCEGIKYDSVKEAELAHPNISIRKRLDNPKYSTFYRLREKTRRK